MSASVPTWLLKPPTGPAVRPPTETRSQTLPFNELSWEDFERLVLRLVRCQGDIAYCSLYGTKGQSQDGLDIVAFTGNSEEVYCFQCKRETVFGASKIRKSINKFLSGEWAKKSSKFVLCVSIPLDKTQQNSEIISQRKLLESKGIDLEVWDGSHGGILSEQLKSHPELVDDFFGRQWVRHFNGEDATAELGDRLDGSDFDYLRARLHDLYSAVFNQHDPGLRLAGSKTGSYADRYVPIEVTQHTAVAELHQSGREVREARPPIDKPTGQDGNPLETSPSRTIQSSYESRRAAFEWLSGKEHCVVLGEPGSGKSALLRYLALALLSPQTTKEHEFDEQYATCLPVWISFPRFAAAIERQPNTSVDDFMNDWLHQHSFGDVSALFRRALRYSEVLLLIDGLDEGASQSHRQEAVDRIVAFARSNGSTAICTSRPRGFNRIGIPDTWHSAVIAPMNDSQVQDLATRWFALSELPEELRREERAAVRQAENRGRAFLRVVKEHSRTREVARNPLLCHALIELYRFSHRLPEARVGVYDKIVELLISQHPAARAHAAYSETPNESLGVREGDLREILMRIADSLQDSDAFDTLAGNQCREICATFLEDDTFGLGLKAPEAKRLASDVVEQLIEQYGLLVERSPGNIGFVHLSIQEYLAAEFVGRKTAEDQLDWLERVWLQPKWRECVTNWFGIQGANGNKGLTGKAAKRLTELGLEGEWQRLQAVELRTEIACTDLGIPISESRKAIQEAVRSVEASSFSPHRTTLAHFITLGAVGSGVQEECTAAVQRWVPGRPSFSRAGLLKSFSSWQAADDLREILLRGLRDEHMHCRLAALDSLVEIFGADRELRDTLSQLSFRDPSPEIRAIALKGLVQRPEWSELAETASTANLNSASAELMLTVCDVRVRLGLANDDDLHRMWRVFFTDAVDYSLRKDFVDILCRGWPTHEGIRKAFADVIRNEISMRSSAPHRDIPLEYLLCCYPMDAEVATLVAGLFDRFNHHVAFDMGPVWKKLIANFKGQEEISTAIRRTLKKHKEKYEAIHWSPSIAPGYIVIGDDLARDELLDAYGPAKRGMNRFWIAKTLIDGWSTDERVKAALADWSSSGIDKASPLASWSKTLFPNASERRKWLMQLVDGAEGDHVWKSIESLLNEFPDDEARELVEGRLEDKRIWYYHLTRIQGCLARNFPDLPSSLRVVRKALDEIDGPQLTDFAASYETHSTLREEVLRASVAAPEDVRKAVAVTIQDRAFDFKTVELLTPSVFAEESGQTRTTALVARVRASDGNEKLERTLSNALIEELESLGTYLQTRRCTALAALIEMGLTDKAIKVLADQRPPSLERCLPDFWYQDAAALSIICGSWHELKQKCSSASLELDLPMSSLVKGGYGAILEQTPLVREEFDEHLRVAAKGENSREYLIEYARRFPRSNFLKERLLSAFESREDHYFFDDGMENIAARLLIDNFRFDDDIPSRIYDRLSIGEGEFPSARAGVIAILALGWPSGEFEGHLRKCSKEERDSWSKRDQLLVATALGDWVAAESAAIALLEEPRQDWKFRPEDVEALRRWAQEEPTMSTLCRWSMSVTGAMSIAGLALIGSQRADRVISLETLIARFNEETGERSSAPTDGLDPIRGTVTSWADQALAIIHESKPSGIGN